MDDYDADAWLEDDDFDAWLEEDPAPEPEPEPVKPVVKKSEPKKTEPPKPAAKKSEPAKLGPVTKKPEAAKPISKLPEPAKAEPRQERLKVEPAVVSQPKKLAPIISEKPKTTQAPEEEDSGDAWLDGDDQADAWLADEPEPPVEPTQTAPDPIPKTVPEATTLQDETWPAPTEDDKHINNPAVVEDKVDAAPAASTLVESSPEALKETVPEVEDAWLAEEETQPLAHNSHPSAVDSQQEHSVAAGEDTWLAEGETTAEASTLKESSVQGPVITDENAWPRDETTQGETTFQQPIAPQEPVVNLDEGAWLAETEDSNIDAPVPAVLNKTDETLAVAEEADWPTEKEASDVYPDSHHAADIHAEGSAPDVVHETISAVNGAQPIGAEQLPQVLAHPEDVKNASETFGDSPDDSAAWLANDAGEDADAWTNEDPEGPPADITPALDVHPAKEIHVEPADAWIESTTQEESQHPLASQGDIVEDPVGSLDPEETSVPAANGVTVEPTLGDAPNPEAKDSTFHLQGQAQVVETIGPGGIAGKAPESAVQPATTVGEDYDGDTAWDLPRADSDAFKFMPVSNRTNSFPAVPPATQTPEERPAGPLPSNQALEFLEEMEKEAEMDEVDYNMRGPKGDNTAFWKRHGPSHSLGGQVDEPEAAAAESRFEEGLPLISHEPSYTAAEQVSPGTQDVKDPFAEDNELQDFIGQRQQADDAEVMQPLQRKSTLQFTGALDRDVSRRSTVDDTLLEEPEAAPATEDLESRRQEETKVHENAPADATGDMPVAVTPDAEPSVPDDTKWDQTSVGDEEFPLTSETHLQTEQVVNQPALSESNDTGIPIPHATSVEDEPFKPEQTLLEDIMTEVPVATEETSKWAQAFADEGENDFLPEEPAAMVHEGSEMPPVPEATPAGDGTEDSGVTEEVSATNWEAAFGENETDFPVAAGDDFKEQTLVSTTETSAGALTAAEPAPTDDLSSKWEQAFGDDGGDDANDFLDDSAVASSFDAAAFLGSDDEGLLDDETAAPVPEPAPAPATAPKTNAYAPSNLPTQQLAASQFAPAPVAAVPVLGQQQTFAPMPSQFGQTPSLPRTDAPKAQSFADKAKGGYASPYDLPTGLVRQNVRPRRSMQQLQPESTAPPRGSGAAPGPQQAHAGGPPPLVQKSSTPVLRSKSSFFEELPMPSKPRPSSRHSNRAPSPSQYTPPPPAAQPQQMPPPPVPTSRAVPPPPAKPATIAAQDLDAEHPSTSAESSGVHDLVQPQKVNPYAALQPQSHSVTPPSGNSFRYSPAPVPSAGAQSAPPIGAASHRYSPAPSSSRPGSSTGHGSMPHLPRTSSPLAHFDSSAGADGHYAADRRTSSSSFDPRLNRVASLPPTREVDEEDDTTAPPVPQASHAQARYSPAPTGAQTPPPAAAAPAGVPTSPSRRRASNYVSQASVPAQPLRAQSQSPDAIRTTAHAADSTPSIVSVTQQAGRPRKPSVKLNMVPPTDGREQDPLERWKGSPIFAWGVGGVTVTSFPKSIPRYAMNQTAPTIVRTVGEVKVQNIKDLDPLSEELARFPGPLRGKSKKREAISWLAAGIEAMEKNIPDIAFNTHLSLEAKRSAERLLLWKLLRVFIEHDGALEGNPAVEKAVREVLAPETVSTDASACTDGLIGLSATTSMNADGVDAGTIEKIRLDLLRGDRAAAVWAAVDKRLWGHAMLIAQTVSPDLYKQVAQEFVRKEVNFPGHRNESLAALYKILSGNYDDCVDELVPSHARAGMQLMSTDAQSGPTGDVLDGLDKWRETLTLVLGNRSGDDACGLNALGKLLSSYGRAEAAQICFMFSRSISKFGGLDDPNVDFVLVGSDHHRQPEQFAKETEALQLSEVYEYGLTLGGGVAATAGAPHLAAYKLQHAIVLAEYGFRDKALQYCDTIATAIVSQTRRSPYHHPLLEASVEDFMTRLKQAPKDISASGWMSKPSMNKVSDSMWNRFNKFVSGDEEGNGHHGSDADNGPFAHIGSSPNISRPSSTNNFDPYGGGGSPGYGNMGQMQPSANTGAGSRYALAPMNSAPASVPATAPAPYTVPNNANPYAPAQHTPAAAPAATTSARTSHEYARNSYEPSYQGSSPGATGGYAPTYTPESPAYQPDSYPSPMNNHQPAESYQHQTAPGAHVLEEPVQSFRSASFGYAPPQLTPDTSADTSADVTANTEADSGALTGGFEPPSLQPYSYEPPSYQPPSYELDAEAVDDERKPKKSFMDDDNSHNIPGLRKPQEKAKEEEDREKEDNARKDKDESKSNVTLSIE